MVERTFDAERDTALTLVDALGHATNGGELHWSYWTVYCAAGGQICRLEVFDFEDESAARTRFEELAREDPRTPYPDNAAVRTWRRSSWLHSFGGDEEERRALIADDIVHIDRRSVLRMPGERGADAFMCDGFRDELAKWPLVRTCTSAERRIIARTADYMSKVRPVEVSLPPRYHVVNVSELSRSAFEFVIDTVCGSWN